MTDLTALLLDLDGTLVDTAEANFAAYAAALSEFGVAVDRAQFEHMATGRHWRQFLPPLLAGASVDPAAVAARKRALYPAMAGRTRLNRQLVAFASAARATLKVGLVTSASQSGARAVLAAHGLEPLFDVIVTGDEVAETKPSPIPYLLAAVRLGVAPDTCLAIEDSETGVESARRAGMSVLKLTTAPFSD